MNYELAKQLCTNCHLLPRGKDGYKCDGCNKTRHKLYYVANRQRYIDKGAQWQKEHPEQSRAIKRRSNARRRQEALDAYGHMCACCGETQDQFLSIDHINGGGLKHRTEIGSTSIFCWLKKNGYPEGFQTLCHNCNMAKGFYGVCPHNTEGGAIISMS